MNRTKSLKSARSSKDQYSNFPYGPVPLSPTWFTLKDRGLDESERIEDSSGGEAFQAIKGQVMPRPLRISERSESELRKGGTPPVEACTLIPIFEDRLYIMTMPDGAKRMDPKPRACYYYFTTEKSLRYFPFSKDFGPLNLGQTVKFIRRLHAIINNPQHSRCRIVYYCPNRTDRIANACTIMALYLLAVCKMRIPDILRRFSSLDLKPYRDASYGNCTYKMTLEDCLGGVNKAIELGWFDWSTFDLEFYEHHEMIDHGDLNWVVPDKFVAFSSPMMHKIDKDGYLSNTPHDYIPIFKKMGITDIVRLNDNQYDREIFIRAGFVHHDLTYPDGSIPNDERISQFLEIAHNAKGAIAIHCKAGLGRTGSMMGLYAIRNYGFTGRHWVAWNRICRPGSVLGPQQQWLSVYEVAWQNSLMTVRQQLDQMSDMDNVDAHSPRGLHGGVRSPAFPSLGLTASMQAMPTSQGLMGPASRESVLNQMLDDEGRRIALVGDLGQAERLVSARRKHDNANHYHQGTSIYRER